jgi:predicted short-subunit dehydrogenase-like oxidoreductase (DUF2520 family)
VKNITIIGAGAVGRALVRSLSGTKVRIAGIYSLRGRSASAAAKQYKAERFGAFGPDSVLSEIVLIAVPDGAIPDVVQTIASSQRRLKGTVVLHTSGALTSDEFSPLKKLGASAGSFHPLQTFPKRRTPNDLTNCWFAMEGDAAAVTVCKTLAATMHARSFTLSKKDKTLYHIAAVFASNYQVTLFSVVEQLAAAVRIPRRDLWRIFRPLIVRTLENVFASSPADALTGPIARGDYRTIMKHIAALETSKSLSHLIPLYSALGVETAKLTKRKR